MALVFNWIKIITKNISKDKKTFMLQWVISLKLEINIKWNQIPLKVKEIIWNQAKECERYLKAWEIKKFNSIDYKYISKLRQYPSKW